MTTPKVARLTDLYRYTVSGTAAGGQTWEVVGTLDIRPGNFALALNKTMQFVFDRLTSGNAVFGKPGVGCAGPYGITKFNLEKEMQ